QVQGAGTTTGLSFLTTDSTGNHRFAILDNGNVGIGTTGPNQKLEIIGGARIQNVYIGVNGNSRIWGSNGGELNLGNIASDTYLIQTINGITANPNMVFNARASSTEKLFQWQKSGAPLMTLDNSGNLGIGTTAPNTLFSVGNSSQFQVNSLGNISSTATGNALTLSGSGANIAFTGAGLAQITTAVSQNLFLMPGGNVGIGSTASPIAKFQIEGAGTTTGISFLTTDSSGTQKFTILDNGNVGIGTSVPRNLLTVGQSTSAAVDTNTVALLKNTSGSTTRLRIESASSTNKLDLWHDATNGNLQSNGDFNMQVQSNINIQTFVGGAGYATRIKLTNSGNLGIGTTNAGTSLSVANNTTIGWGSTLTAGPANGLAISGNTGIGTTSPSQALEVTGRIRMDNWTADGDTAVYKNASGDIGIQASDIRLKKNIIPLQNSLDIINGINGVTFNLNTQEDETKKTLGVIAQDVLKVLPEAVFSFNNSETGEQFYGVHYEKLTALLIEGVKQQQGEINSLSANVKNINLDSAGDIQIIPDTYSNTNLADIGDVESLKSQIANLKYTTQKNNDTIYSIAALAGAVIGKIKAGTVNASQIATDLLVATKISTEELTTNSLAIATENITIGGQNLHDYIIKIINSSSNNITSTTSNSGIISPIAQVGTLKTNIISPLASDSVVMDGRLVILSKAKDPDSSPSAQNDNILEIQNASGSAVTTMDNNGNATFSGTIRTNNLEMKQFNNEGDATISGTLHADRIIANEIEGLEAKVATLAANYVQRLAPSELASSSAEKNYTLDASKLDAINVSSYSAQLSYVENLSTATLSVNQGLMVFGPSSFMDVSVAGQFSIGTNFILADSSINTLGSTLEIQPLRQGAVSIMAGAFYIDTNGNAKFGENAEFEKDIKVNGTLSTNIIAPVPNKDLLIKLGSNNSSTPSGSFVIQDASGSGVLTIDNEGNLTASKSGSFNDILTKTLNIVRSAQADTSMTETIATASAGTATIIQGETERTIITPYVTDKSLIYITPTSDTQGATPYIARQTSYIKIGNKDFPNGRKGSFTIQIPQRIYKDINVNWWIVN
ncbi:tail fiber domain-containing protein, partial [Candidatus Microgenomates bacterium]